MEAIVICVEIGDGLTQEVIVHIQQIANPTVLARRKDSEPAGWLRSGARWFEMAKTRSRNARDNGAMQSGKCTCSRTLPLMPLKAAKRI